MFTENLLCPGRWLCIFQFAFQVDACLQAHHLDMPGLLITLQCSCNGQSSRKEAQLMQVCSDFAQCCLWKLPSLLLNSSSLPEEVILQLARPAEHFESLSINLSFLTWKNTASAPSNVFSAVLFCGIRRIVTNIYIFKSWQSRAIILQKIHFNFYCFFFASVVSASHAQAGTHVHIVRGSEGER